MEATLPYRLVTSSVTAEPAVTIVEQEPLNEDGTVMSNIYSQWTGPSNPAKLIRLSNKNFVDGTLVTYNDLVGKLAHEIGHGVGLNDNKNCTLTDER